MYGWNPEAASSTAKCVLVDGGIEQWPGLICVCVCVSFFWGIKKEAQTVWDRLVTH